MGVFYIFFYLFIFYFIVVCFLFFVFLFGFSSYADMLVSGAPCRVNVPRGRHREGGERHCGCELRAQRPCVRVEPRCVSHVATHERWVYRYAREEERQRREVEVGRGEWRERGERREGEGRG